ncbi:MAG: hydrogenase iron-sulfur subunit [Nitrososphaerota archaeon]|jgi:coenzyme F420-reducing hydrogenase delta subunit|nr:hydrogenase iron-sulfur subunit [Nitrososphaerota archaeon]MDG7038620.1 hydrogenase iron-sulfur subunit [Nitrososphaerota archaeon]MDG7040674.1 hydrogenase iron-sulfur subunit [Nitrososphaerota archaeon]MDG7045489.1 hydrogenase iron-sulfur subunit [Nitrososphaerota archaeon]
MSTHAFEPKILVFSTNIISDPGIDQAGMSHINYPSSSRILRVPCSSMIRPEFIIHAFESGFDAVFIAADGGDCPYLSDCSVRTARNVQRASEMMKEKGIDQSRLRMAGICSVCSDAFAKGVKSLYDITKGLGPVRSEGHDRAS